MHELSLVEGIRDLALRHALIAGGSRILSVRVALGDSSSYLEDAMAMFWDVVCEATVAAGARFEVVRIPGEWLCVACFKSFAGGRPDCCCPHCGSEWVKPAADEGCYLDSIEVENG